MNHEATGLEYKRIGKEFDEAEEARKAEAADAIRAWREERGIADAEKRADAHGELTYEQEMEWMYGPNWKDDPGLMEKAKEDIDELANEPSWGFLRDDMTQTEKIYVHVTEMPDGTRKAEWDDSQIGRRTYIYPKGTEDSFIWYSQEFDNYTWRAERSIWGAPPHLHDKHKLAYEVAPDEFKFIEPNEVEPPVNAGGAPDWTHPDDPNFDPDEWWYTGSVQPISTRRMTADGRIIEQNSPEYVEHLEAAIKDIGQTTMEDIDKVAYNIYQGSIPRWDTLSYGPEPDFSALKGGLYKTRLNVNPDEFLDWFEPINTQPKALQDLINKYLDSKELLDNSWGSYAWLTDRERARLFGLTGQQFFGEMSRKFGWTQFRDDMDKVGMPGMLYRDWTRDFDNKRPTYNVVMYSDKPIDILERGAANAPFLASVFGITSTALTAAALSQKPDVISPLVLEKDISEQFPMPEREVGMMEQIASNPNVKAAMYHPLTQYLGLQLENSDLFARVAPAVAEGMLNLAQGKSLPNTGSEFVNRMATPYDQTMDETAKYVADKTGSPALGALTYTGMFAGDITNYIGP